MTNLEPQPLPKSFHSAQFLTCEPCHLIIPSTGNPIVAFLWSSGPICPACKRPVDVWASVLHHLKDYNQIGHIPLGPITTIIRFEVPRNGRVTLDLSEHGIPADSRVLDRSYCGNDMSGIASLEVHGSSPVLGAIQEGNKITIYGAEILSRDAGHDSNVSQQTLSVVWVPRIIDTGGWSSIWNALEAFARRDYQGVVVPANVAVELAADCAVTSYLDTVPALSKENVRGFLEVSTYSHRLNVVVPLLAHLSGAPQMDAEIRNRLNGLRKIRNKVSHEGRAKQPPGYAEAAQMLCAAIFGFHYMNALGLHLLKKPIFGLDYGKAGNATKAERAEEASEAGRAGMGTEAESSSTS